MTEFNVGDKVYASDWCYGTIVLITRDAAIVEFETECGGGTMGFPLDELVRANE